MSSRSLLIIAIISATAFTGCKTVYSSVYANKKNSFKPPVAVAKNEIKGPEMIDRLTAPPTNGMLPGGDQNAIPGIPGLDAGPAPAPAGDPAAPAIPPAPAPAIPGL